MGRKHGTDFGNHGVFWIQYVFNALNYKNIVVYLLIQVNSGSENHEYTSIGHSIGKVMINDQNPWNFGWSLWPLPSQGFKESLWFRQKMLKCPGLASAGVSWTSHDPGQQENAGRSFMWTCLLSNTWSYASFIAQNPWGMWKEFWITMACYLT